MHLRRASESSRFCTIAMSSKGYDSQAYGLPMREACFMKREKYPDLSDQECARCAGACPWTKCVGPLHLHGWM